MDGWIDGWMDRERERERERAIDRYTDGHKVRTSKIFRNFSLLTVRNLKNPPQLEPFCGKRF